MKGLLRIFIILFLVLSLPVRSGLSLTIDPVFPWIESGDTEQIESWLENHDINSILGEPKTTLLIHSILRGNTTTTSWLIEKGADVNQMVDDISPLMHAAGTNTCKQLDVLIRSEVSIEAVDPDGNTALFYAAKNPNLRVCKHLIKKGKANVLHKNKERQTAYDMAVTSNNRDVAAFLRANFEKNLPDYRDGPYVRWKGKQNIRVQYLVHDSKSQITRKFKAHFKADSDPYTVNGFSGDTLNYLIHSEKEMPADLVSDAERIMVIGDIHGGYDSLVLFLQNNGVINNFQWTWGTGHLVFIGDIFDRGEKVTEALWLIYQLEEQARIAGGAVHMILGNHEILVLSGELDYIAEKYRLMSSKLNIDYSYFFNKNTVLGQWLRTKNTILRINGHLFVHAGLSPEILECGLDIHEINNAVRYFLNHPDREDYKEISRHKLMGNNGPFWYRGYIEDNHDYKHLPDSEFEKVLKYFAAQYIYIGHTNVKEITALYNNRVFALDVPFYSLRLPIQGILLEKDVVYVLNSSASKRRLN